MPVPIQIHRTRQILIMTLTRIQNLYRTLDILHSTAPRLLELIRKSLMDTGRSSRTIPRPKTDSEEELWKTGMTSTALVCVTNVFSFRDLLPRVALWSEGDEFSLSL